MAINEVWNLQVRGVVGETQHIHNLHFIEQKIDLDGDDLLDLWAAAPMTAYRACFSQYHAPTQLLRAAKVCGTVPLPAPTERVPLLAAQAGTKATTTTEPMPAYVASLTTVKGSLAGRRYSGRFFLGGLYEPDVNGNVLSGGYVASVQAYCDALKTAFVTAVTPDFRLFVFSNLLADGDPDHVPPVTTHPCQDSGSMVANFVVSNRPTTMRSRKLGHGL